MGEHARRPRSLEPGERRHHHHRSSSGGAHHRRSRRSQSVSPQYNDSRAPTLSSGRRREDFDYSQYSVEAPAKLLRATAVSDGDENIEKSSQQLSRSSGSGGGRAGGEGRRHSRDSDGASKPERRRHHRARRSSGERTSSGGGNNGTYGGGAGNGTRQRDQDSRASYASDDDDDGSAPSPPLVPSTHGDGASSPRVASPRVLRAELLTSPEQSDRSGEQLLLLSAAAVC